MEATLKFNLDDYDDKLSHLKAVHAEKMYSCLWEIMHNGRKRTEDKEDVFQEILNIINENNLTDFIWNNE